MNTAAVELAEGVWCKECEFFEVEDFSEECCLACGSPENIHVDARVVSR